MLKYNQALEDRWNKAQEIQRFNQQNAELKALLNQYMNAKSNDQLQIPPNKVILAQAGLAK